MSFKYHYNLIYNDLDETFKSFEWDSIESRLAIKTACACVTSVLIANWIKLDNPFWSVITTFLIMRSNVGASFQRGWMRSIGCCIGCMLCFFFVGFFVQNPLFFSIFLFTGVCLAFYIGVQAKYDYFWSYMLANMTLIAMVSIANPYDNYPMNTAFYRGAEITLGVLVTWFYNIILWPRYAGDDLEINISTLLYNSTKFIREILYQYSTGNFDKDKINCLYNSDLKALLNNSDNLLKFAESEKKILNIDYEKYKLILTKFSYRIEHLALTYKTFNDFGSSQLPFQFDSTVNMIIKQLDKVLILAKFNQSHYLKHYTKLKKLLKKLENEVEVMSNKSYFQSYSVNEVFVFYEFLYAVNTFTKDILLILGNKILHDGKNSMNDFELKSFDSDFMLFHFKSKVFPLYIPALKNSIKGALAILCTFWIALWLNIPGGYSNMAVAIIAVFSPQMDNMSTKHKGILRFFGCLSGAALGLLLLSFSIDSTFFLGISIFFATFFFCIISAGKPGCSYLGAQGGIACVICLTAGFEPSTSMSIVIERLTGIFLAISMMWFFYYVMFPENLVSKLRSKIIDIKSGILDCLNSGSLFSNERKTAHIYAKNLKFLNSKALSLAKVIELQQDMPLEDLQNIKEWTGLLQKISRKLIILDSFDNNLYFFINKIVPKINKHFVFAVSFALDSSFQITKNESSAKTFNKYKKYLETLLINVRTSGVLRNEKIQQKKEFAVFIITLKHLIYDLNELSSIKIDLKIFH